MMKHSCGKVLKVINQLLWELLSLLTLYYVKFFRNYWMDLNETFSELFLGKTLKIGAIVKHENKFQGKKKKKNKNYGGSNYLYIYLYFIALLNERAVLRFSITLTFVAIEARNLFKNVNTVFEHKQSLNICECFSSVYVVICS